MSSTSQECHKHLLAATEQVIAQGIYSFFDNLTLANMIWNLCLFNIGVFWDNEAGWSASTQVQENTIVTVDGLHPALRWGGSWVRTPRVGKLCLFQPFSSSAQGSLWKHGGSLPSFYSLTVPWTSFTNDSLSVPLQETPRDFVSLCRLGKVRLRKVRSNVRWRWILGMCRLVF